MNKFIVYEIVFVDRELNNIKPSRYIGSKSNCEIINGKIIDRRGKEYKSSSTCDKFWAAIDTENYIVELLYETDNFEDMISKEREIHKEMDVVASELYFNKGYATESFYSSPGYVTAYDKLLCKYIRIPKEEFYNNERYTGTTNGTKVYNDGQKLYFVMDNDPKIQELGLELGTGGLNSLIGSDNPFYGKTHSEESKKRILEGQQRWKANNPDEYNDLIERCRENAKEVGSRPKGENFKRLMSQRNKGKVFIKHILTGENIHISAKEYYENYQNNPNWLTLSEYGKLNSEPRINTCPHCGMTDDMRNASFQKWHFNNCKKRPGAHDRYSPWRLLHNKNDSLYLLFSKMDVLYDIVHVALTDTTISKKYFNFNIAEKFGVDKCNEKEYRTLVKMIKKIKDGYNPTKEKLWIDEFYKEK